jgi:adenine-specific DNA glycosylase
LSFDTNLEKVFSRYYFGDKYRKLTNDEKEEIQKQFTKTDISGRDINNALMDFSSLISLSKEKIDWKLYPLKNCEWYKTK